MSRTSTRKVSMLALLTSAVFTISSLAPIDFAPGPFTPDAAFAKSENGNGGKGGGRGGDKGGGKSASAGGSETGPGKSGTRGGGRGGKTSTAKGGKGGNKGVGGMLTKATKKGGDLINSVFGRDKAKTKTKTRIAGTAATNPNGKLKPRDLMAMGLHPSDLKGGLMGVLMASPNGNFNSSATSVHGLARDWMETAGVADLMAGLADDAQMAADDLQTIADDAQMAVDDLQKAADEAQTTAANLQEIADNAQAAVDALPADDPQVADLQTAATEAQTAADEAQAAYDGQAAELQTAADEAQTAADDAQIVADEAEVAADEAQAESVEAFEAITKGKTPYGDGFAADIIQDALLTKVDEEERWQGLVDEAVADAQDELDAAAEAEAAAEAAAVEGETVVDEVSLIGTDGETIALAVEPTQ